MTATYVHSVRANYEALALHGGEPIRRRPLPQWPTFDSGDLEVVGEVLRSGRVNYWTGEQGRLFEQEFARWADSRFAVAVSNGTVALELALRALDIGPGDEVIVPSATFIATASAVVACGATPVVVDVDPNSQALTAQTVRTGLTARTRAIIVVHLGGYPADVEPLLALARDHELRLVEDCAQAHGAARDGRRIGTYGDIAAWSFCQDKIMTTGGEGGAITTDDRDLHRRCWEFKDHGKSWEGVFEREHPAGFRWLHDRFGTNARMTELQAAIGRNQLHKIDEWVAARQAHAGYLRGALSRTRGLRMADLPLGVEHAYYRFYAHVVPAELAPGWGRDRIITTLNAEGIPAQHGGCTEIHRERAFATTGRAAPTPVASELGRTSLTLPIHPALAPEDVADIAMAVRKVFNVATGGDQS